MKINQIIFCFLAALLFHSFAMAEEANIDFRVDASALERGQDQISFEWQTAEQFKSTKVAVTDLAKVHRSNQDNLQMVNAKVALISNRPISDFSLAKLATAKMVGDMLRSVSVTTLGGNNFNVTNKVKAYGLPFKVNFTMAMRDFTPDSNVKNYFTSQATAFEGTGKEFFITLDMTKFSQLIYRNYSMIYVKELTDGKTLVIATIMCGINIDKADSYFNYPPISRTENTMMNNLRSQTLHMIKEIKN